MSWLKRFAWFTSTCFILFTSQLSACSDSNESSPPPPVTLNSPARIASFTSSHFLVSDLSKSQVCEVNAISLEPTKCLKTSGLPSGVVFFDGRYYVGIPGAGSVEVLDLDGSFLFYLGGTKGLFGQVNDVAFDITTGPPGLVYVLDTQNALIKAYSAIDGTATGFEIDLDATLTRPSAMTVDPATGAILVSVFGVPTPGSSAMPPQIRIYNKAGGIIGTIYGEKNGSLGTQAAFSAPQGLFVDDTNHMYLVDARFGEVLIYDLANYNPANWHLAKKLGSIGTDPGELYYPLDVFVDNASKDVFVADNRNSRITVFREGGLVP